MIIDEAMARAILFEAKWRRRPVVLDEVTDGDVVIAACGGYAARNIGSAEANARKTYEAAKAQWDALLRAPLPPIKAAD